MAEITAAAVKTLRERTGLPMMDCKKALQEAGGDADKAVELLRKAGAKMMEKRAGRATTSGRIAVYVAPDGQRRRDGRPALRKRPGGRPTSSSCNWPTTWPSNWPRVPGPARPRRCLAQPSPSKPGAHAEAAVRRPEQPHPRGVQARADRADRRPLRRLRPSQRRGRRAAAIRRAATPSWPRTSACTSPPCGRPCSARRSSIRPWWPRSGRSSPRPPARKASRRRSSTRWSKGRLRNFYAECCLAEQPFVERRQEDGGPGGQGSRHEAGPFRPLGIAKE